VCSSGLARLGFGELPDLALDKVTGLPKYKAEKHGETLDFDVCASGLARLGFVKVPDLALKKGLKTW